MTVKKSLIVSPLYFHPCHQLSTVSTFEHPITASFTQWYGEQALVRDPRAAVMLTLRPPKRPTTVLSSPPRRPPSSPSMVPFRRPPQPVMPPRIPWTLPANWVRTAISKVSRWRIAEMKEGHTW